MCELHTKFIQHPAVKFISILERQLLGDHQCGYRRGSAADHIFCILQILEKKWECNEAVHQLFIHFKKTYDSVRSKVLYNILTEFGIRHETGKANKNVSE